MSGLIDPHGYNNPLTCNRLEFAGLKALKTRQSWAIVPLF